MRFMQELHTRITKDEIKENILSVTICIVIIGLFFTNISSGITTLTENLSNNVALISKSIIGCILLFCIPFILYKVKKKIFVYTICLIGISFIQFAVFPNINEFFKETLLIYTTTIFPVVICFISISDYDKLLNKLVVTSFFISIITLIAFVVLGNNLFSNGYSMGFANIMIFPTNILIYYILNKKTKMMYKILSIILFVSNIFVIFAFGSRGALLDIVAFFLFEIFFNKEKSLKKYLICFTFIIALVILILFYQSIIQILIEIFSNLDLNSRTLYILLTEITHDSGRSELWNIIITGIKNSPFSIRGINAEYLLLGIYSHNFILDLLYEFGLFLGIPAIGYISYGIIKTLFAKKNGYTIILQLVLFSFFPLLLLSESIWTSMFFWIWFLCFSNKKV